MSRAFLPARRAGVRGRRWWAWAVGVWVWVAMVPLSLVLAQSYLLGPLPGQRGAWWGGYPAMVLTVVAAALFAAGAPAMADAQVGGVRGLRGQVGLLPRGRRRSLARRVRAGQAVDGGDREAAGLIARCTVLVGDEAVVGAGVGVMALGMGVHAVVAWQVAAAGLSGMAAAVASLVRYRAGWRAARWVEADRHGRLAAAGAPR